MKRLFLIILVVPFLLLIGCSSDTLKRISIDELKEKITNKETFVVYFSGEDDTLKDKLETALKENNLHGFYLDTKKITNDEKLSLETSIAYENASIVFVINGVDSSKLSHVTNKDISVKNIVARLKDMNFIKS